jgi:hypothetical protein
MLGDIAQHHAQIPRVLSLLRVCLLGRRELLDLAHVSPRLLVHGAGHVLAQAHTILRGGTALLEGFPALGELGHRLAGVHRTLVLVNIFHHRSLGNGYCDCTY